MSKTKMIFKSESPLQKKLAGEAKLPFSKLIIANWKMNHDLEQSYSYATEFANLAKNSTLKNGVVICPPAPYLSFLSGRLAGVDIYLGGQDCSGFEKGAYTGETSAKMLKDVGCDFVLIGHSERRQNFKEDADILTKKIKQALDNNLYPIFCVGESEAQRAKSETQKVLTEQLKVLENFKGEERLTIAYEPVWAIGTGKVATTSEINHDCQFITQAVSDSYGFTPRVLYGGSVKADNAADILSGPYVGGVLVGGASLKADEFWKIFTAV